MAIGHCAPKPVAGATAQHSRKCCYVDILQRHSHLHYTYTVELCMLRIFFAIRFDTVNLILHCNVPNSVNYSLTPLPYSPLLLQSYLWCLGEKGGFDSVKSQQPVEKKLVPRNMTCILHLLSVVAGAGVFIFRQFDLKKILQQRF